MAEVLLGTVVGTDIPAFVDILTSSATLYLRKQISIFLFVKTGRILSAGMYVATEFNYDPVRMTET